MGPFFTNIDRTQNFNYNMHWTTEQFHAGLNLDVDNLIEYQDLDVSNNITFLGNINYISTSVFNNINNIATNSSNISALQYKTTIIDCDNLYNFVNVFGSLKAYQKLECDGAFLFSSTINSLSNAALQTLSNIDISTTIQNQLNSITSNITTLFNTYVDKENIRC